MGTVDSGDLVAAPAAAAADVDMVGGIEGFVLDEDIPAPPMQIDIDIDWNTGDFDPEQVKYGKCKEVNTMSEMNVFEAIAPEDIDSSWTWLSARWENQQRDDEVR